MRQGNGRISQGKKYSPGIHEYDGFQCNTLYRVNELVRAEAARYGVTITGTELIGLTPAKALFDAAEYYLQIEDFDWKEQVIESHLLNMK